MESDPLVSTSTSTPASRSARQSAGVSGVSSGSPPVISTSFNPEARTRPTSSGISAERPASADCA